MTKRNLNQNKFARIIKQIQQSLSITHHNCKDNNNTLLPSFDFADNSI